MRAFTDTLFIVFNVVMTIYFSYTVITALFGFFKFRPYPQTDKRHRFLAVIAARNEEKVLPFLLESIRAQNYPSELIDVLVVADNCTDRTADIARGYGVHVLERHDMSRIGKGYALKYAFTQFRTRLMKYDAVCIIDADNLMHPNFFAEMNKAYAQGCRVAQGYRRMKNASDTWVSGSHALFFWLQNRFFNRARGNLGLSATINGTGYMVSADLIYKNGWDTCTLTEDIEYTIKTVLSGNKVAWVPDAIIYDEQPLRFKQSWTQRKRWSIGCLQCLSRYTPALLKKLFTSPNIQYLDTISFLITMPLAVIGYISVAAKLVLSIFTGFNLMSWLSFFVFDYVVLVALSVLVVALESRRQLRALIKAILAYPFFLFTWPLLNFYCFFVSDLSWKPIAHVRTLSIEDMLADLDKKFSEEKQRTV